jgi:hypothetical protein
MTARSPRWGPVSARPAAASRSRAAERARVPAVDLGLQGAQRRRARLGHQRAELGDVALQGVEPGGVGCGRVVGQQTHAFAHRSFVSLGVSGMAGDRGEHQAIEEPASIGRALEEQAILRRGQPDLAQMVGEPAGRHGLAFDPHRAPRRARRLDAGSKLGLLAIGRDHS